MKVIDFVKAEIERLNMEYRISIQNKNKAHCNFLKSKVAYLYKICEACEETGDDAFNLVRGKLELFGMSEDKINKRFK